MQQGNCPNIINLGKKKRTTLACEACRKKRIKCDGNSPCDACIKSEVPCIKSRQAGKRGPKAGYIEKLESRIKLLESLLTPDQWSKADMLETAQESPAFDFNPITSNMDLRLDLIALFFKYDHQKLSFLHEQFFMQNIRGHRSCLLYAMYSLGAMYESDKDAHDSGIVSSFYYELAVNEVNAISVKVADYHLIGTYLLLMLHEAGNLVSRFAIRNSTGFKGLIFSLWTFN
jgi:hypothetical protein